MFSPSSSDLVFSKLQMDDYAVWQCFLGSPLANCDWLLFQGVRLESVASVFFSLWNCGIVVVLERENVFFLWWV